jgi:hypothetical protein
MNAKQKRRLYRLHYNLRRRGNSVKTRERTVTKRAKEVTDTEWRWLHELSAAGYGIMDGIFNPDRTES